MRGLVQSATSATATTMEHVLPVQGATSWGIPPNIARQEAGTKEIERDALNVEAWTTSGTGVPN